MHRATHKRVHCTARRTHVRTEIVCNITNVKAQRDVEYGERWIGCSALACHFWERGPRVRDWVTDVRGGEEAYAGGGIQRWCAEAMRTTQLRSSSSRRSLSRSFSVRCLSGAAAVGVDCVVDIVGGSQICKTHHVQRVGLKYDAAVVVRCQIFRVCRHDGRSRGGRLRERACVVPVPHARESLVVVDGCARRGPGDDHLARDASGGEVDGWDRGECCCEHEEFHRHQLILSF